MRLPLPIIEKFEKKVQFGQLKPTFGTLDFANSMKYWNTGSNTLLFTGFAMLYLLHQANGNNVSQLTVSIYACGWNYIYFLFRSIIHVSHVLHSFRDYQTNSNRLVLELLDISTTSIMFVATTLSMGANLGAFTGVLATLLAPLASLSPALCSVVASLIEGFHALRAYKRAKLPYLLRDRMRKFLWIKEALKDDLSLAWQREYKSDLKAMRTQLLSVARVALALRQVTIERVFSYAQSLGLRNEFDIRELSQEASGNDFRLTNLLREQALSDVRSNIISSVFWVLVGLGVATAALSSFYENKLLYPAFAVIGAATVLKLIEVFEIDRYVMNFFCFCCLETDEPTRDNFIINFFARREKEKSLVKAYSEKVPHQQNMLAYVPRSDTQGDEISLNNRVKMRMVYEVYAKQEHSERALTEIQFYKQFLQESWWSRYQIMKFCFSKVLEWVVLSQFEHSRSLISEDREKYVDKACRQDYRFFSCFGQKQDDGRRQLLLESGAETVTASF